MRSGRRLRGVIMTVLLVGGVALSAAGCVVVPVPFPVGGGHHHGHRH